MKRVNLPVSRSTATFVEKHVEVLAEPTISGNVLPVASFDESVALTSQAPLPSDSEYRRGLIVIGFITLLFSSNSPALHAAFSESSPPVLLLNAAVSCVALVGLILGGPILEATTPLPSSLVEKDDCSQDEVKAGLELGLWKFLGTTANLYGLSLTTAGHGAFLIQLTTLIVPVVQGLMGVPIPRRVQFSIVLALAGVFMFTQHVDGSSSDTMALGDLLCVVAAGFYATYDLRLFQWGKLVKPRNLITNKIATQAVLSILLLLAVGQQEAKHFLSYAHISGLLVIVVLWSGVAVNAIAPFLQVGGQQAVGPTRAQTLYASQPLWASILSYIFLEETVGSQGLIGGLAFLAALFLAATAEAPDPNCGQDNCEV
jgi:drug/metabolite transporter (DMT)-like permease